MTVKLIVAVSSHTGAIGKDNDLMWNLPSDMKHFKDTTRGIPVLTGRKNYESIPPKYRPLPGRANIVITRDPSYQAPGATVCVSIKEALTQAKALKNDSCFVIGGGQIYKQCLAQGLIDELYITWVNASLDGDAYFEGFEPSLWEGKEMMRQEQDPKHEYSFRVVHYIKKKEVSEVRSTTKINR